MRVVLLLLALVGGAVRAEVTLGGWVGALVAGDTRPGSKPGLDVHPWYLFIQAEPVEDLRVFGELEMEHLFQFVAGAPGAGEIKLERLYLEKGFSTAHNVRVGKTFTPFGYWYRLHWAFLTETVSRPFSMDNAYVPRAQVGVQYWGRWFAGNTELAYYAWVSNGPDIFNTDKRTVIEPGFGASVFATHSVGGRDDLTVGATVGYHTQWVPGTDGTVRQDNLVGGLEAKLVRVDLRGEFYWHRTTAGSQRHTLYGTAAGWVLPQLAATYRFDWGNDARRTKDAASERAWAHSFGVLWRPHAAVVARVEARQNVFHDTALPSYWQGTLSVAVKY